MKNKTKKKHIPEELDPAGNEAGCMCRHNRGKRAGWCAA